MIVQALEFSNFAIKKMNRASVTVENKRTGEQFYMARRVFNTALENPETPLFVVRKDFMGMPTNWLATPMTF
jgi:hypothetical protein